MNTNEFNEIYRRNYNTILNYCISKLKNYEVCEEIANDVFIKFTRLFDSGVYNDEKSAISTYLFTTTNSAIIDYLRSIKIEKNVELDDINFRFISNDNILPKVFLSELNNNIELALNKLKPTARKVAEMYFIDDMKYIEIAEILNISLSNVKVTILRAREVLQAELKYCR